MIECLKTHGHLDARAIDAWRRSVALIPLIPAPDRPVRMRPLCVPPVGQNDSQRSTSHGRRERCGIKFPTTFSAVSAVLSLVNTSVASTLNIQILDLVPMVYCGLLNELDSAVN